MSIEHTETLPPNGHSLHAYEDGLDGCAHEVAKLRDALDGATSLAHLLRRDSVIAGIHDSSVMSAETALRTGTPLGEPLRGGLETALCICVDVASGIAHELAQAARDQGSAGLARFANDRVRGADMPSLTEPAEFPPFSGKTSHSQGRRPAAGKKRGTT